MPGRGAGAQVGGALRGPRERVRHRRAVLAPGGVGIDGDVVVVGGDRAQDERDDRARGEHDDDQRDAEAEHLP